MDVEIKKLRGMTTSINGAHCGLTDWYPEIEAVIRRALKLTTPWTTGWYASKKEIATAMISYADHAITVTVSVSDDFDTDGRGTATIKHNPKSFKPSKAIEDIRDAIYIAWDFAEQDQESNSTVQLWKVCNSKTGRWVDTYLEDTGEVGLWGHDLSPPGDNYHNWGWQFEGGHGRVPKNVRDVFTDAIFRKNKANNMEYKGYTLIKTGRIEPCKT